jgi:CheY-like chemotaxis protein
LATILCIDDENSLLEMERALLESNGYNVFTASDGPAGIALARKLVIDAVLLDLNMPGMDGSQVAQILIEEQPKLRIVIRSGFPDQIPEALKWFADAVLYKGDGPDALLSVLERIVGGKNTPMKAPAREICRAPLSHVPPAA